MMRNLITEVSNTEAYRVASRKNAANNMFWSGSDLRDIHALSSKSKGAILEKLVIDLCYNVYNLPILPRYDTTHDSVIGGYTTEIKVSMSWDNVPDNWRWQQIRRNQVYDRMIFAGANPDGLYLWWATKADLNTYVFPYELGNGQHGGGKASETYWIYTKGSKGTYTTPEWFRTMEEW
jgi:hypothetical protein